MEVSRVTSAFEGTHSVPAGCVHVAVVGAAKAFVDVRTIDALLSHRAVILVANMACARK